MIIKGRLITIPNAPCKYCNARCYQERKKENPSIEAISLISHRVPLSVNSLLRLKHHLTSIDIKINISLTFAVFKRIPFANPECFSSFFENSRNYAINSCVMLSKPART